jgi:hypothetical protein
MLEVVQVVRLILIVLVVWGLSALILVYGVIPRTLRLYLLAPLGILLNYALFIIQRLTLYPPIDNLMLINIWSYFLHGVTLLLIAVGLTVGYQDLRRNGNGKLLRYIETIANEDGYG